jgi:hypothetical protein
MFDFVYYYLLAGALINSFFIQVEDFVNLEELFGLVGAWIAILILTIVWPVSGYFLLALSRHNKE